MPDTTINLTTVPSPFNTDGYEGVASGNTTCMVQPAGASVTQTGDIRISGTLYSNTVTGANVKVGTLAGADADAENWIEQAATNKTALVLQAKASATDSVLEVQDSTAAVKFAVSPTGIIRSAGLTGPSNEMLLSSTAAVDMNTATATTLYTVPTGFSCLITKVIVRLASTSLTTASYSFGYEATTFANVIANATHTELTGNTLYTVLSPKTGSKVGTAADTFKVLMNTLQGGAATTTIDVLGILF